MISNSLVKRIRDTLGGESRPNNVRLGGIAARTLPRSRQKDGLLLTRAFKCTLRRALSSRERASEREREREKTPLPDVRNGTKKLGSRASNKPSCRFLLALSTRNSVRVRRRDCPGNARSVTRGIPEQELVYFANVDTSAD